MVIIGILRIDFGTQIGNYIFNGNYCLRRVSSPDTDVEVESKKYDYMLHELLSQIFRVSTLSNSDRMKELNQNDSIKAILEQEPILSRQFSKEELAKLPLLWIAVLGCYQDSAELLVRSGADVNDLFGRRNPQVIDEKWTVLHVLIQMEPSEENKRLVRLVRDHGADMQASDSGGRTILQFAVVECLVPMIEILLEKEDVNVVDWDHSYHYLLMRLAVLSSSSRQDRKFLKLALDHGANVNVQVEDGTFPLYLAVIGSYKLVRTLLERGANVHLKTIKGRTALHNSCKHSSEFPAITPIYSRFHIHSYRLRKELVELLLFAGADLLAEDRDGKTPFALIDIKEILFLDSDRAHCMWLMIKALALKKVCQPSIVLKDEIIIEQYPAILDYYRDCIACIYRMKFTRFIRSCTFFDLLVKSHCRIAWLMQNPNFETNFGLYDLSRFSMYEENILRVFECAKYHYPLILEREKMINEVFHYTLPHEIVRKIVNYTFNNCCIVNEISLNKFLHRSVKTLTAEEYNC